MMDQKPKPYISDFYSLIPLYPTSGSAYCRSILAWLVNQLTKELNSSGFNKLPRFILIIPDKDIIEAVHFGGFGCKPIFEKILDWLGCNLMLAVNTRKEDMRAKCPGAIRPNELKLIWITMPIRPFIKNTSHGYVFAQSKTFNTILTGTVTKFPDSYVFNPELVDPKDCFYFTGEISPIGKMQLWHSINRKIRLFDRGKDHQLLIYKPYGENSNTVHKKTSSTFPSHSLENAHHVPKIHFDHQWNTFH